MAFLYKALAVAGEYRIFFYNKVIHRYSHYSTNPYSNDRKAVERPDDLFIALNDVWDYLYNKPYFGVIGDCIKTCPYHGKTMPSECTCWEDLYVRKAK